MKAVTDPIAPNIFYTHFILDGTKVVAQYETDYYSSTPQGIIYFYYDESGSPTGMKYNGNVYFFQKNLQGDIIRILNSYGSIVATYTYDAWGNIIASTDTSGVSIGTKNPFRYRGYYYDTETGLYYLNSRYYDPQVGRFLNADGFISTGQGLLGSNMFAYCLNNPVVYGDHMGSAAKNQLQRMLYDDDYSTVELIVKAAKDTVAYVNEKIIKPINEIASKIEEDIVNYDSNNQSEDVVFESNYFSSYKGALVVKTPFDASFSYGFIGLSKYQMDADILKHEYGHTVQMDVLGVFDYTIQVAIPSITINLLRRKDKLTYDYYSYPWEATANILGGATLYEPGKTKLPEDSNMTYWDLFWLLFE